MKEGGGWRAAWEGWMARKSRNAARTRQARRRLLACAPPGSAPSAIGNSACWHKPATHVCFNRHGARMQPFQAGRLEQLYPGHSFLVRQARTHSGTRANSKHFLPALGASSTPFAGI